ncbi:MAG: hypothetical protein B7733_21730 [Myxococcales bacterium FL481]|nr:MAG: hypothetical protein B7733_21730 [Myxococcales bacterium FL481]
MRHPTLHYARRGFFVLAVLRPPTSAHAEPVAADASAAEPAQLSADAEETARRSFERGQSLYDTLDYEGAIEAWTETYAMFPDSAEYTSVRGTVLYAIAQARLALFGADQDVEHLRHAQRLLVAYKSGLADSDVDATAEVDSWIRRVEAKIEEAQPQPKPKPTPAASRPPADVQAADTPPLVAAPLASASDDPLVRNRADRPGRGLVLAGTTLAVLGGTLAAVGGTLASVRAQQRSDEVDAVNAGNPDQLTLAEAQALHDEGRRAEIYQAISFAGGGALLAAGTTMLIVGLKRRGPDQRVSLVPHLKPRVVGLVLEGRF